MNNVTPSISSPFSPNAPSPHEDSMQLCSLSRDSLVRVVEQAQQDQHALGRRLRSKKENHVKKRTKHAESKDSPRGSREERKQQQQQMHQILPPRTVVAMVPSPNSHKPSPPNNHDSSAPHQIPYPTTPHSFMPHPTHHQTYYQPAILPPSQRVDNGMDEVVSTKSSGTDSNTASSMGGGSSIPNNNATAPSFSCPPPVNYHPRHCRGVGLGGHQRTSYRSLTSNASSTALELECLVSVATPPGLLRNTTSSSVRWDATAGGGGANGIPSRPSNPVAMQVETPSPDGRLVLMRRQESGVSAISAWSGGPPPAEEPACWKEQSPHSSFAPYQPPPPPNSQPTEFLYFNPHHHGTR